MVRDGVVGCCCPPLCVDGDPATLEVVFSGVTDCGCVQFGAGSLQVTTFDLSGPYTLTWDAGSSSWLLLGAGSLHVQYFNNADCTDMFKEEDQTFDLQIQCTGDDFSINAQATLNPAGSDILRLAFSATGASEAALSNTASCVADITAAGTALFSGGTATISA